LDRNPVKSAMAGLVPAVAAAFQFWLVAGLREVKSENAAQARCDEPDFTSPRATSAAPRSNNVHFVSTFIASHVTGNKITVGR
jgi:hypothetical protein